MLKPVVFTAALMLVIISNDDRSDSITYLEKARAKLSEYKSLEGGDREMVELQQAVGMKYSDALIASPISGADCLIGLETIMGVDVRVRFGADSESYRYLSSALKTKIELELRKIGITIANDKIKPGAWMFFSYEATDRSSQGGIYGTSVQLHLVELVYSERLGRQLQADTWHASVFGFRNDAALNDDAQSSCDRLVSKFLNDYLKANPIQRASPKPNGGNDTPARRAPDQREPIKPMKPIE